MVCDRCIISVRQIFENHGLETLNVNLGEVQIENPISEIDLAAIDQELGLIGFQIYDKNSPVLVIKIKAALVNLYNQQEISEDFKLSTFLTEKFPYDYSHLSRVFSQHEQDTIEHYVIKLRIEKAKELLTYGDKNVSEVAYRIGYSSAAHFSRQFKKIVGVSPSIYQDNPTKRKSLEDI